jgi:hypothetical protein
MVRTTRATRTRRLMVMTLAMGAAAAVLVSTPAQAATSVTWRADLSTVDNDDVNVRSAGGTLTLADTAARRTGSDGYLTLAEHDLGVPANRISASVSAKGSGVEVYVRGKLGTNDWTEWQPAGVDAAALPKSVSTVQVRIGLESGDQVDSLSLTADQAPQLNAATLTAPLTYKVYATREGLTGHTTANGHVIVSRDHFVSLPSGRSLSSKGTGNYTVRVCKTDNSRCEYAPVWDVGPWNIQDDYWNPAAIRQMWKDLPQGTPEAQAAYSSAKYNGGKDDEGRTVPNPAGIDLADGVFYDGLKMADNGYVTVSYLWTGSGPTGVVSTAGDPMNVRASASTTAAIKGVAANHAKVDIECYSLGDTVAGTFGTTDIWDRIGTGQYVSDTYLQTGSDAPVAPLC